VREKCCRARTRLARGSAIDDEPFPRFINTPYISSRGPFGRKSGRSIPPRENLTVDDIITLRRRGIDAETVRKLRR